VRLARATAAPRSWTYLLLLWLAGIDLRITLLAVPPVLPAIHHDLVLSEAAVGALTGLPVLLLGAFAVAGSLLIARLGARRAWLVGLMLVAVGGAARGAGPNVAVLFGMTFVMGLGVAVCQPAAPTLIGEWLPRSIGFATAVYVNGLLVGETLGAALTIPYVLPMVRSSWEWSLVFWSLPVFLTVALLALGTRDLAEAEAEPARWWPSWRDGMMWQLGIILAGASTVYWASNAFIPDYLHAVGKSALVAPSLSVLNFGQLPASFATLLLAQRLAGRREVFIGLGALAVGGLLLFLTAPAPLALAGIGLVGAATSFTMVMVLALPPMAVPQRDVHRMSAGFLTLSYGGTFLGNLLSGILWDATRAPLAAFAPALAGAVVLLSVGMRLKERPSPAVCAREGT
jgi:CP family cyanate transporter-like MFS transporter